jgi:hypothetical protein
LFGGFRFSLFFTVFAVDIVGYLRLDDDLDSVGVRFRRVVGFTVADFSVAGYEKYDSFSQKWEQRANNQDDTRHDNTQMNGLHWQDLYAKTIDKKDRLNSGTYRQLVLTELNVSVTAAN